MKYSLTDPREHFGGPVKKQPNFLKSGKPDPKTVKFILFVFVFLILAAAGIAMLPHLGKLFSESGRDALVNTVRAKGATGVLFFIGVQILQVVLFIIPGEVVEVAGGVLYGTVGGYAVCTVGSVIGSVIIYCLVRRLGYDFVNGLMDGKFGKLAFLKKKENIELAVFILFLIPGTPKDGLTYFVPFTNLSLPRFLVVSTVARIPSVISSTFAGASLESGNITVSLIVFAITAVLGVAGILIDRRYIQNQNRLQNQQSAKPAKGDCQ